MRFGLSPDSSSLIRSSLPATYCSRSSRCTATPPSRGSVAHPIGKIPPATMSNAAVAAIRFANGALGTIDYLSTVSGGGYTGGFLAFIPLAANWEASSKAGDTTTRDFVTSKDGQPMLWAGGASIYFNAILRPEPLRHPLVHQRLPAAGVRGPQAGPGFSDRAESLRYRLRRQSVRSRSDPNKIPRPSKSFRRT